MNTDQKRMFLAVVLSGLILFGWQFFIAPKSDVSIGETSPTSVDSKTKKDSGVILNNSDNTNAQPVDKAEQVIEQDSNLETVNISDAFSSFKINSFLMVQNISSKFSSMKFKKFAGSKKPFSIVFKFNEEYEKLFFSFTKIADNRFEAYNKKMKVTLTLSEDGSLKYLFNSDREFTYKIVFNSKDKTLENNQRRTFAVYSEDLDLLTIGDEENENTKIQFSGIDYNYHIFTVSFPKRKSTNYTTNTENNLIIKTQSAVKSDELRMNFTKKDYDRLATLGNNLQNAVDFGMWSIIAVPILRGLQFFYTIIPNYGISIIFLTLIIRLLTFPLQYKSFKSMKKMQDIQPELTALKEKFKEDPKRMQQESMALFKRAGANPMGGCLPMILQLPVFFAFYKVLYSAVELVGAPFFLWIIDLSEKDPYYVLPFLMAVTMFLQQKLNPSTAGDPTQQKIMKFMPIIFGFIMKDLPAGLTLYIFVSTLLGIFQQMYVYKKN